MFNFRVEASRRGVVREPECRFAARLYESGSAMEQHESQRLNRLEHLAMSCACASVAVVVPRSRFESSLAGCVRWTPFFRPKQVAAKVQPVSMAPSPS